VHLDKLASQLEEGCVHCGQELRLFDIVSETRQGLGSILRIRCRECTKNTNVATDSRHGVDSESTKKVWDVNTKAALGN